MIENVTTNNLCIDSCFNDNNNGTIFRKCCSNRDSEISDDKTNLQKENGNVDDFEININVQNINIYRYKFTDEFMVDLYQFSKIHQYDDRHDFKEAWKIWMEENEEIIEQEIRRITELGYRGEIIDKMFKSARYYFRKKPLTNEKEQQKRRVYTGLSKNLLYVMDQHIMNNLTNENQNKPSITFLDFCKENKQLLGEEILELIKVGIKDQTEIMNKIKKTYKNRYFYNKVKITK